MKHIQFTFLSILLFNFPSFAQNPISPPGVYIADPSAHVWADDRLYIYGSNDESTTYYCSWTHHVLSTSDLKTWELTRDVFSTKGENDQVPYNDNILYAPDCQYKYGTYVDSFSPNEEKLSNMKNDNRAAYKYLDFTSDINKIEIRVKPGKKSGTIQLTMDQPWHQTFATINVPESSGKDEWITMQADIKPIPGVHALWLKFIAENDVMIDIDWFRFSR